MTENDLIRLAEKAVKKLKEKKCYDKPGVKRRKAKEEMIKVRIK